MAPDRRTTTGKVLRLLRVAAIVLGALELAYLLVGNLVLSTGVLRRALSTRPDRMLVDHGRAYTVLPGRVHLSDFSMRMQDRHVEFLLTVTRARVDVHPLALLRRTFHGDHVRCEGVSFRLVPKVHDTAGIEPRVAAYASIPGFARPPLLDSPPPPAPTQAEIDAMWTVRLDDVQASVRELWFLEYRWEGAGRVAGGFELSPLRRLRVGPATLVLEGGELRAGPHRVARETRLRLTTTVGPFDVQQLAGIRAFRAIGATLQLELKHLSPGVLALYVPDLTARGSGSLAADVRLEAGRLAGGSRATLDLEGARAELAGVVYEGSPRLRASFDGGRGEAGGPRAHVTLPGHALVPVPRGGPARVDLEDARVDVALAGHDLAEGIALGRLTARIGEARVADARAVSAAAGASVPLPFLSALLGGGPLVASGAVEETKDAVVVARLGDARLGAVELRGAARRSRGRWDGAAAGHVGIVPFGVRLEAGKPSAAFFVSHDWLQRELATAGIRLEAPAPASEEHRSRGRTPRRATRQRGGG